MVVEKGDREKSIPVAPSFSAAAEISGGGGPNRKQEE
jgi:hypothetical protein